MMSSDHKEEIHSETQLDDNVDGTAGLVEVENGGQKTQAERKKTEELIREPGRSLLPFARVQKIIKADKEIPIVAKEATFLISFATEEFIKRLSQSAHHVAQSEKRSTVQHRDVATIVRRVDEFLFLEEIIPWISTDYEPKRPKPKPSGTALKPTLLAGSGTGDQDIVMNEDGTMEAHGESVGRVSPVL